MTREELLARKIEDRKSRHFALYLAALEKVQPAPLGLDVFGSALDAADAALAAWEERQKAWGLALVAELEARERAPEN